MAERTSKAGWIIETGVLVPAILSASLPSPFTMRTFAHDKKSVRTLRIGEIVGGAMVLALGVAESLDNGTVAPLIVVVVVSGVWFVFIEWAIRSPINGGTNMAAPTAAGTGTGDTNAGDSVVPTSSKGLV